MISWRTAIGGGGGGGRIVHWLNSHFLYFYERVCTYLRALEVAYSTYS